jgi:hypothetical protein
MYISKNMSNKLSFVIDAGALPSKKFSVTIEEPTFKDRRDAAKKLPSNPDSKIGYSLEQLLLSMSISKINNRPIKEDPRDPIYNIRGFSPEDTQFLLTTFLEAFTLNDELADDVRNLSQDLRANNTNNIYTIPSDRMPNQLFSVTFGCPTTGDQIDIERKYPGADSNCGYTAEELLFAAMVTHVDGKEVSPTKDYISLLDEWTHIDAQYALGVFLNLCYINREERNAAKELGKSLRKNVKVSGSTSPSSKASKDITTV